MAEAKSKFWLDIVVDQIIKQHPKGEIIVESGISPSGSYHVGSFREAITTDVIAQALRERGRQAKHVHFVDDFDPLRKLYPFLPASFEKYIGWPYWMIPDPVGDCHKTYAEHYFVEFKDKMDEVGAEMEVLISHEQYMAGFFDEQLNLAVEKADKVRAILSEASGRDLPDDWTGVWMLDDNNMFHNIHLSQWPEAKKLVKEGKVKLVWRLDWPARWARVGVDVEPFGREHATKGGSYETGAKIIKEIFGHEPPFPVPYDTINLPGETKKMSSSLGNVVSLADALSITPPEVMRYFILRGRPERKIFFDPGMGLHNLIDEFAAAQSDPNHEFKEAYHYAVSNKKGGERAVSSVPFSHLVQVYQASQGDADQAMAILSRTGYEPQVKNELGTIKAEFGYIKNWLAKYAPEEVKFQVHPKLPKIHLEGQQKGFLTDLGKAIENQTGELEAQWVHDEIYKLSEAHQLKPAQAFQAIYQVILGQDHGPKAGWFLAGLGKTWLSKRLQLQG